jgi:hypothetical protein
MPSSDVHRLHVDAVRLAQPGGQRQRPRLVHLRAERRVDRHAPVASFVAEPLDQDRPVVRQGAGGLALLGEVGEQVDGGVLVEPCLVSRSRASSSLSVDSSRRNAPGRGRARPGRPGASPCQ